MIVVHHLDNSRSQRVLWLLEELGVPYEVRSYRRNLQTMLAPPELKGAHPLGKSPVLVDGDLTLAESGAIVEYLADRYGDGRLAKPFGSPERVRYIYWLHYAEGSAMTPLLLKLTFDRVAAARMPFFVKPIVRAVRAKVIEAYVGPNLQLHLDYLESELARAPWFCGDELTAADVQMSFPVELAVVRAGLDEKRPRLMDWLRRVHARPAYQRALERGGKYDYANA
ncbi:MAG TPA: glutathione S-transferase [Steroidobacteraceae bacterium]|jgi:glutathione S-transferase|nr:glutathione S-transferase [Steroidobacteraceae bacterium]